MMAASPTLIVQITDTHLLASDEGKLLGLPTEKSLAAVIAQIKTLNPQPHGILLTGDLSQDETSASYERLHQHLEKLNLPAYWIPGNHDQPLMMEKVLTTPPAYGEKSFRWGGWQFILLNSAIPGRVYGYLTEKTLHWLELELQRAKNAPTVVALHHPPFAVDSPWIDKSRLQNPEDLFRVLDSYPQVRLVLFGHIHQNFCRDRAGIRYLGSPSSSVQFKPSCQQFTLDEKQPGYRLLWLYPDGKFETDIKRVEFSYSLDFARTGY